MGNRRIAGFVLAAVLSTTPLAGYAADELSDTQTAAKHVEQGIAHLKANNLDAAISEFEESNEILPDAESSYYLGYAYYLKSRKDNGENRKKSLEYFEQAYEIDPNFSPARYKTVEPTPEPTTPAPPSSEEQPKP
jgi:tetratricopeptide (TPR) repeat protein